MLRVTRQLRSCGPVFTHNQWDPTKGLAALCPHHWASSLCSMFPPCPMEASSACDSTLSTQFSCCFYSVLFLESSSLRNLTPNTGWDNLEAVLCVSDSDFLSVSLPIWGTHYDSLFFFCYLHVANGFQMFLIKHLHQ